MKDLLFLGIDSGSQSTKVALIDSRGTVVCEAKQSLRPLIHREPGWAEHPDDDLWEALKGALYKLWATWGGDKGTIAGMGLCSIRCCRVFLDQDGLLAEPVMSWMDVRAYQAYRDESRFVHTGSSSGYLTRRLTGCYRDTVANAFQGQFPVDMERWDWAGEGDFFSSYGIPREKLMEAVLPGTVLGKVTQEAAGETGLPEGLPVVATANDKAVEALGSGLVEPGTGLLSLGTYITSMVAGREYRPSTESYYTNLSAVPHRYLYESGGIRGGMAHFTWFHQLVGGDAPETVISELEKEASRVPAGSEGLLTVPDWLAPADQPQRKGVILGFEQRHTRAHMYRSLMEAIALTMKNHFEGMMRQLEDPADRIVVCGGGSNSDLFMQIIADSFGIPAVRTKVNGAASLGAAVSAAVASGVYPDYRKAVEAMVHTSREFTPNQQNLRIYRRLNTGAFSQLPDLLAEPLAAVHAAWGSVQSS